MFSGCTKIRIEKKGFEFKVLISSVSSLKELTNMQLLFASVLSFSNCETQLCGPPNWSQLEKAVILYSSKRELKSVRSN